MKKSIIIFFVLFLALTSFQNLFAVSEAAVLFLMISPSAQANGMGNTFMALDANETMGIVYNPAFSGISAMYNKISFSFYPTKTPWLSGLATDLTYECKAANIGLKLSPNIYCGIGYYKIDLDLGQQYNVNEQGEVVGIFSSNEKAQALTFGVGINHGIKIGLGTTLKSIQSNLAAHAKAEAYAYDVGAILQIPLIELMNNYKKFTFDSMFPIQPFFLTSLGYSISNIGKEISYIVASQADPLPRLARIGYSFDFGFSIIGSNYYLKAFAFKWTQEANDLLVKSPRPPDFSTEYKSMLGDINIWKNLILNEANKNIIKTNGWEVNFLECFFLRKGKYNDPEGKVIYDTEGFGISSAGCFKLLSFLFSEDKTIKLIAEHFELRYNWSRTNIYAEHPLAGTEFNGINIILR